MNDLVSIIINCHNGEKFLSRCLESVINQTYENWEIIFWDNCSTDNSKKIFQRYNDGRFNYYKSDKLTNLSIARNLAISKSKGKYVSFLDVDDYWEKNKISSQISFFKNEDTCLIFSNFYFEKNFNKNKEISIKKKLPKKNMVNFFLSKYPVSISTVIFNKKIIRLL